MKDAIVPYARTGAGVLVLGAWMAVAPLLFGAPPSEAVNPVPFPADRYAKLASQSPFTPPTAPTVAAPKSTPPPPPSFTEKLTVTAIMQIGSVYHVTVVDQENPKHIDLYSNHKDDETQMQVESVRWPQPTSQANPGAPNEPPVITITKGQERGQVRYEPGVASPGAVGVPTMPGMPNGVSRSPTSPFANNAVRSQVPPIPGSGIAPAIPGQPSINNVQQRAPIRALPQSPATGARPIVRPGANIQQPGRPAINVNDDDDDDDE